MLDQRLKANDGEALRERLTLIRDIAQARRREGEIGGAPFVELPIGPLPALA